MQVSNAISFLLSAIAVGLMSVFPPPEKPVGGSEVLRSQISPAECQRLGGKIQYANDEVYQGVRGCWIRRPEP